jgi:hypothetical protein
MGLGTASLASQVKALLDGQLVIPSIQRDYVWRRSQVPLLLDSLYREFPVGSLMVWKTAMDVPLRPAAVLQSEHAYAHPSYLLDGQQRITSLARIIAPDRVKGAVPDVRFDVRSEKFLNPSAVQKRDRLLIPVTDILSDSPQFVAILAAAGVEPQDEEFSEYVARLARAHGIRSYALPVLTVESDDYEEVAEIFTRVNQGGRRLSKGDLVYSAVAARWPEGLDVMETFRAKLDGRNFALDREAVLRLTGLLAGVGAQAIRLIDKRVTGDDLKKAWARTEDALSRAVDFLEAECTIPRAAALTSPNVAVIPAYLLHQRKSVLSDAEVSGLRRWVYTAMAFSHYSSQVETKLDAEVRVIDRGGPRMLDELIRRAADPRSPDSPLTPDDLEHRTASSPLFTLLYIAALRGGAKDWLTNAAMSAQPMTSTSKIEFHHVFPKAKVQKAYGPELTNSLANLAFITGASNRKIGAKDPAVYLPPIKAERLLEQWVPAQEHWRLDGFETFLAERRQLQAAVLNDLLGLPHYSPGHRPEPADELPMDDEVVVDDGQD